MMEATTLLRFVHHGYSGRPSMDEPLFSEKNSYGRAKVFMRGLLMLVLTMGLMIAAYSAVAGSDSLSGLISTASSYFNT